MYTAFSDTDAEKSAEKLLIFLSGCAEVPESFIQSVHDVHVHDFDNQIQPTIVVPAEQRQGDLMKHYEDAGIRFVENIEGYLSEAFDRIGVKL